MSPPTVVLDRARMLVGVVACCATLHFATPADAFSYSAIDGPILSATFSADFAALVAHRTVAGFEVNRLTLIDPSGGLPDLDLSLDFYGAAELLLGETPSIAQGPLETGVFSAAIPSSFFPVLSTGRVGLSFLATDTDDGLFAIDALWLTIHATTGTTRSFIDANDGFGIGLPDGGSLSDPLPISIAIDASGTGFDEAISSKSHHTVPIPQPAALGLVGLGSLLVLGRRLRRRCGEVDARPTT